MDKNLYENNLVIVKEIFDELKTKIYNQYEEEMREELYEEVVQDLKENYYMVRGQEMYSDLVEYYRENIDELLNLFPEIEDEFEENKVIFID